MQCGRLLTLVRGWLCACGRSFTVIRKNRAVVDAGGGARVVVCVWAIYGRSFTVIRKNRTGVRARHKTNTRTTEQKQEKARQRTPCERHKTNNEGDPDRLGERPQGAAKVRRRKGKGSRAETTRGAQQEPRKHTSRNQPQHPRQQDTNQPRGDGRVTGEP